MFVPGILIQIMRVAVVFDTPYSGWDHPDHERQMELSCRVEGERARDEPFISYGHDMATSAAKAGMEYSDFIQRIVDSAMARYEPT
jgi:hypothetical protein